MTNTLIGRTNQPSKIVNDPDPLVTSGKKAAIGAFFIGLRVALLIAASFASISSLPALIIAFFLGATFVSDTHEYRPWYSRAKRLWSGPAASFWDWANLSFQLIYFVAGYAVVILLLLR